MRIFQVDAFTDSAFAGNPAAVCLLDRPADPRWMQQLAAEMNLAETAFLDPRQGGYGLRWFTPVVEVALCGHATLASSHVLFETGLAAEGEPIRFDTASGPLAARKDGGAIVLDFPATPAVQQEPPPGLLDAIGVSGPAWTGRAPEDFLVVVAAEEEVTGLRPDMAKLAAVTMRGVIVTAPATRPGADFVSRFFAPAVGIPEDPVTGSAHCTMAPYWFERLGRSELTGFQASPRGGTVRVQAAADRILLTGYAVTVLTGELSAAALPAS
jgi:PhzF family phenazine biosynthesis protein